MDVLVGVSKLINSLAPVNQLPPEILGMIPNHQEDQTPDELVTVSGVCSYWRDTFLATPSLWTKLDGRGIEKTRAWILRSRGLPIQLEVEGSPDLQVMKFLAPHFPRLDVMDLSCLGARDRFLVTHNHLAKLLRPNSLLRVIDICASDLETLDTPVIMGGEFPSLEKLLVMGIKTSITNLRTPNLRDLFLAGKFHLTSLLDFLESSPLLESVILQLDPLQDTFVGNPREIALGKLKSLNFFYHGFIILQHLLLPPGGEVMTVEAISPDQLHGTTSSYAQLLSRAFNNLPMSHQAVFFSFQTEDNCRAVSLEGPNGTLKLMTNEIEDPTACITLLRLFAQHSFGSIRHLTIDELDLLPGDSQLVTDFVRSLDNLRSMAMYRMNISPWLWALGANHCPRLHDLHLQDQSRRPFDCHEIAGFVKERSEAGIPIRMLCVGDYSGGPSDAEVMEILQKYVEHVLWT